MKQKKLGKNISRVSLIILSLILSFLVIILFINKYSKTEGDTIKEILEYKENIEFSFSLGKDSHKKNIYNASYSDLNENADFSILKLLGSKKDYSLSLKCNNGTIPNLEKTKIIYLDISKENGNIELSNLKFYKYLKKLSLNNLSEKDLNSSSINPYVSEIYLKRSGKNDSLEFINKLPNLYAITFKDLNGIKNDEFFLYADKIKMIMFIDYNLPNFSQISDNFKHLEKLYIYGGRGEIKGSIDIANLSGYKNCLLTLKIANVKIKNLQEFSKLGKLKELAVSSDFTKKDIEFLKSLPIKKLLVHDNNKIIIDRK